MHWRGHSATMNALAQYDDVVADVVRELGGRVEALVDAGVDPEQLVLDPGLGFAKQAEHNWAVLARLDELAVLGRPLLVGASRKRFLGSLLSEPDGEPRAVPEREAATVATTVIAAMAGAWCVRVHDVPGNADAVRVVQATRSGAPGHGRERGQAPVSVGGLDAGPVLDADGRPLDRVALHGLRARGRHGVLDFEKALGQDFVVDVVLHLDVRPAAAGDDLTRTVHYGELAEQVVAVVAGEPVELVETLAERIAASRWPRRWWWPPTSRCTSRRRR